VPRLGSQLGAPLAEIDVEKIFGPIRRSASPETVLEELWKTLALRIKSEKALSLDISRSAARNSTT
jgi:hypothetical protein